MMKQGWIIGLLAVMLPWSVAAQVEKQVEVTKSYVPQLEQAEKLAIEPDMTDTMQLRPEIDYTITPLSLQTTLATSPMRPAKVTYWEFNRPRPFYAKVGVGYPWQSVADFYAATQNPGTGYAMAYLNHDGRYADIKNDFGVKNNALRMMNRVGGAAGKYLGKHIVEGDVNYTHRAYRRYGACYPAAWSVEPGEKVGYSDVAAMVRIGDDFQDLSRTNFEVKLNGNLFYDHTDPIGMSGRGRQTNFGAATRVERAFANFRLGAEVEYSQMEGGKSLDGCRQQLIHAALHYARHIEQMSLEVGIDYYYDRFKRRESSAENYVFPRVRLEFDLVSDAVKPFVELDGSLATHDFRSLTAENPYLPEAMWLAKSTPEWALRGGLTGHSKNNRFRYRLYLGTSLCDNYLYWLLPVLDESAPEAYAAGWFLPWQERQIRYTLGGELRWRPATHWAFEADVNLYAYDDKHKLQHGEPEWKVALGVRYEGRKVRCGLHATMMGERWWAMVSANENQSIQERMMGRYEAPATVDLNFDFEWSVSGSVALFVEGHNLLGSDLYRLPTMPEYGVNALMGVRMTF